ncbi:unnamed protein product [Zymoseptoria tritici ST99CH_1A5]|uniref:DNA 3'-5' helicase n=3 Tax=Zymoseptoria tritici TaxID=1047171 RepID=A0A2H1GGD4_ZYMTR|nr:unnamed protein product [Zymoseptoria tritici ST99CH_1E4]SMR53798.1 unnamed protein product [Zymoseptoria tritici ST99CH_3D1]SMY24372.1 unnamed protein product [Zymoseptoria tritici ST99CH_1A5]
MEDILHGLNNAQRSAVASPAEVLQVLAPPGSGKTKTLTARVAYLVACKQLRPWNIIVCTFTVKAASEMKERITSFVGADVAKQLKLGTFHSVALRYLRSYGQYIGLDKDFNIADSADSKAILKRVIKRLDLSIEPGSALGRISSRKAKGIVSNPEKPAKKVEEQEFDRLYDEYEATLAASKLLDYDDILLRCCFLLRSHPQCVANVEAVLIDEFQDTNNVQFDMMSLFSQKMNVITIVGDPDQSIYGFRSAEIKNLTRMKKQWPDTLTINLEENYRSSGAILHAAQKIIEQDEKRPPKKLQATHSYGMRPVLRKLPSAYDEAEWLVSEIKRVQAMSGNMMQPDDFAILLRSAALSRAIEAALGNAGVAYRMVGGLRFYDRVEVKLIVDYLRVISQPDYSEAVERIVNVPPRRVGEETVKKLREEAREQGMSFWKLIIDTVQGRRTPKTKLNDPCRKGLASFVNVILSGQKKVESWGEGPSLVDLINIIAQKISFQAYLKSKYPEEKEYEARWSNVEELMAQAADLSTPGKLKDMAEADRLPTLDDMEQSNNSAEDVLSVFLANISLAASEQKAKDGDEQVKQVTISTIHASKGLEWPVVFIPACYEGSIPHSRADDNDEERRLLYVGMTRAQALLYLSCPIKNTQKEDTTMSSFLTQPGAASFFEEHGPNLALSAVTSLSTTLRRDCPQPTVVAQLKKGLERDEDNFWPLNGEQPPERLAKWDNDRRDAAQTGFISASTTWAQSSSVTMDRPQGFSTASSTMPVVGFTSVAARYDELMEQAQLRKVDNRAKEKEKQVAEPEPKGKKRQIEGQGTIASFFAKKGKTVPAVGVDVAKQVLARSQTHRPKQPLRELPDGANNIGPSRASAPAPSLPSYKPRSTPMFSRPEAPRKAIESPKNASKYVFLSSSPTREEPEQENIVQAKSDEPADVAPPTFRPASTLHSTTMSQVQPQRRTLGMRRSLHGWSAGRK